MSYNVPINCQDSPLHHIPIYGPLYQTADAIGIPIFVKEGIHEPILISFTPEPSPVWIEIETVAEGVRFLRGV